MDKWIFEKSGFIGIGRTVIGIREGRGGEKGKEAIGGVERQREEEGGGEESEKEHEERREIFVSEILTSVFCILDVYLFL